MDPVDQLAIAGHLATLLRSCAAPDAVLADAYKLIGVEMPPSFGVAMAVRIAQLCVDAEGMTGELLDFVGRQALGVMLNRQAGGWGEGAEPEGQPPAPAEVHHDPEAEKLLDAVDENGGLDLLGDLPPFSVAERGCVKFFDVGDVVIREGRAIHIDEAGEQRAGDSRLPDDFSLPTSVWGVIDYPLENPVKFRIETGPAPWSVWQILMAFADQYMRIYAEPERYGVWGHHMHDLWIESLSFHPDQNVMYPFVGS